MPCVICEHSPGAYELVEHVPPTENRERAVAAEVCAQCAEKFLLVDRNDPACAFCDTPGEYDLIEDGKRERERADAGSHDSVGREEGVAAERVVCEEHLRNLESDDEEPGGQAPAQGQDASAGEAEGEADTEEPVVTNEAGETDAERPAEHDEETVSAKEPTGGEGGEDTEQERPPDSDQEPVANPDAMEREQRPGDGDDDGDGDREQATDGEEADADADADREMDAEHEGESQTESKRSGDEERTDDEREAETANRDSTRDQNRQG